MGKRMGVTELSTAERDKCTPLGLRRGTFFSPGWSAVSAGFALNKRACLYLGICTGEGILPTFAMMMDRAGHSGHWEGHIAKTSHLRAASDLDF